MSSNSTSLFGTILGTTVSSLALLATYYFFFVAQKPVVYTRNEKMKRFLQRHLRILNETYWPTCFYWEGRLQTFLGLTKRVPSSLKLPYKREIFPLSDGGELALDTMEPEIQPASGEKLVVILLPGLTSSSRTSYVKTLVMAIVKTGATVVVFNNRGIGGIPLKSPRTHSAGNCDDIRAVITHLKNVYADDRIMALGTSLGAMILCHYLASYPEEAQETFHCALVISNVWDYYAAMDSMERGYVNKNIINYGITRDVVYRVKKNQKVLEQRDCWDFAKVDECKTGREFDRVFHVPQFGYKSLDDYYQDCLISGRTHKFSIPVFGLNSRDDPMQQFDALPISETESSNSKLGLIVTNRGGHLGFLEGFTTKAKPMHFMERFTQQFVAAVQSHGHELM